MYAAIDIHKRIFQAAVVDDAGEITQERFDASPAGLADWLARNPDVRCVAIEATSGWRWVARELGSLGVEVTLVDPVQARGLQGRRRSPKTDRLDARWLALLLARNLAPAAWAPPEEIQRLRDLTRLRPARTSASAADEHDSPARAASPTASTTSSPKQPEPLHPRPPTTEASLRLAPAPPGPPAGPPWE